jgi:eukaryotic-like serine/threonine-protein kinase
MTDLSVGTTLAGKYLVEGVLGRGGMGIVVAARHIELDQRVAIKCLLPEAMAMAGVVERFAREARAAVKIHGEHVARVLDVGRLEDGTPFMVMEYLEGHDLAHELAERGALPVEEAVRYVLETCEAVVQAHKLRIVHRDLKPSNLFLAETPGRGPIVKVLDFGISKVSDKDSAGLTKTASVMGTAYYMSPEQLLSSKNVDERADIWSLGVILYELACGDIPFGGESAPEVIAKILQNAPPPPRELRPDLPPALEATILRCMRTKPEDRFANVAELAGALAPFASAGDRESVVAIARVLGLPPPSVGPTMVSPGASHPSYPPSATPQQTRTLPVAAPSAQSRAMSQGGTAHNLAVSQPQEVPELPKRGAGRLLLIAVAAVVVIGAGSALAFLRPGPTAEKSPPSSTAVTTTAAPPAVTVAPAAAPAALPALAPDDPSSPSPSTSPSPSRPGPAAPVASARGAHAPAASAPPPVAALSKSLAAAQPPPPQPPPPPPPPAQPAATRNPLDLQIK